jgi:hypothetical protein
MIGCRTFGGVRGSVVIFSLGVLMAGAAFAQQPASIYGTVTDESGAVLPGVTVVVSSPALQGGSRTTVAEGNGEYRVTPLPIGIYDIEYTLEGFRTVSRKDIRVTVGFAARVDVAMSVGSLEERITVTGASPVVDVTQTAAATVLTLEALETTPNSRQGLVTLYSMAPGVRGQLDVGGSSLNTEPSVSSFGQPGEPEAWLEGVVTRFAAYWNYLSVEEAQISTVGNGAEVEARGVQVNAIVKSGGNQFHGSAGTMLGGRIEASNVTDELAAQGLSVGNDLQYRDDFNADLGGRIIRDKLWFYGGARLQRSEDDVLDGRLKEDGTPVSSDQTARFATGKTTYQMSQANRIIGFYAWSQKHNIAPGNRFNPWESRTDQRNNQDLAKAEWQFVGGRSLVTSAQFGYYGHLPHRIRNVPHSQNVRTDDIVTRFVTGPATRAGQRNFQNTYDTRLKATLFRPGLFLGDHEFKAGFSHTYDDFGREYGLTPDLPPHNYQLRFASGVPTEIRVLNYPSNPKVVTDYMAFFVQDQWNPTRRLRLNLGIRRAKDDAYSAEKCRVAAREPAHIAFPAQCYPKVAFPTYNVWDPRLHASFDVLGDGKTVLRGGWAAYTHKNFDDEIVTLDPEFPNYVTYRWRDLNNNRDYDPGEVNLDPNGPDYLNQLLNLGQANPDLVAPTSDEINASLERELIPNLAVRVLGVYSKNRNNYRVANVLRPYEAFNIPVTNPDPGPDGRVGTADDPGVNFTYWEYSPTLAGQRFERPMFINDPNIDQTFKSIELGVAKRSSDGWMLNFSYMATKKNVPLFAGQQISEVDSLARNADYNPNPEINHSDQTWEWNGHVSGSYELPYGIQAAGNYQFRSGRPYAREVLFRGGRTITNLAVLVEPYGSQHFPDLHMVDVRFEKRFSLGRGQNVSARANIYNLMNKSTPTDIDFRSGPTYGLTEAIIQPRIMDFGFVYSF